MVRIFQRYIFLELIKTLVLAVATFSAIFFLVQSVVVWQKYGLSVGQLMVTMPFIFPTILNYSLPMATLVTCTFAYGRLSADNEILAIQSAGIHLFPIVAPALILGLLLCPLTLQLYFDFIPRNAQRAFVMARENVEAVVSLLQTQKRVEIDRSDGSVFIITIDRTVSNRFIGVNIIQDFGSSRKAGQQSLTISAREGYISPSPKPASFIFELYGVTAIHKDEGGVVVDRYDSEKHTEEISVESSGRRLRFPEMTQDQLWDALVRAETESSAAGTLKLKRKLWAEIHDRWAMSFTCFVFAMLGVPLGIFSRKGNVLAAFASGCLPVFLLYYPMQMVGKAMAVSGGLPVALGMWAPDVFLTALGGLLLYILFRR